ncbi:MAG: M55 family metallopeptidase [Gemmatimonadota bacterium]
MHKPLAVLAVVLLGAPPLLHAQAATDIFLADVMLRDGRTHVTAPLPATDRDGYDNQPWFLPDGSAFLYASERDGQTDIFRFDIASGASTRLTNTPENEYSPTLPLGGERLMVVRWPTDMSTGALWWFTPDGRPLEEARGSVPRVGYYTFVDERTLALFINDSIQSFMLNDTQTGDTTRVGRDMGGSAPRTIPRQRAVSYLSRAGDGQRWLTRLDVDSRRSTPLVPMLEGVANYTWTPRGTVLAARGATLYEWSGRGDWREVVTFADPRLQDVSRLALSPAGDRLALVSARPDPDAIGASASAGTRAGQEGPRVFISVDMEGLAGVVGSSDVSASSRDYEHFRTLMAGETNAAVEGALAADASYILVRDSHGAKTNLLPGDVHPSAHLLRGQSTGPKNMMEAVDSTFDAVVFIGYHARAGTPNAILEHTSTGNVLDFSINGVSLPEGGYNALVAGLYGVPVVFVAGDRAIVDQLRELVGPIGGVAVKREIADAALGMSPAAARAAIRAGVEAAIRERADARPYALTAPYTMVLKVHEERPLFPGARRTGDGEVTFTSSSLLEVLDAFNAMK